MRKAQLQIWQQQLTRMVYIKLTNDMWVLSGLQKLISPNSITTIDTVRYIPYVEFRNAAKITDQPIHSLIKRDHIITNIQMKQLRKQSELSPDDRKWREQLKLKHQMRVLKGSKMKADAYYFQEKQEETVKDFTKSISFGMTFIFSFFMAGITGYYFGVYFLNLSFTHALIVAALFIMGTITVETTLFIIKQSRQDGRAQSRQKEKLQRPTPKRTILKDSRQRQDGKNKID